MLKDRVEIYIYTHTHNTHIHTYIFVGFFEVFVKAVIENQMACPQMVMYLHLLRGPMPLCVCQ